jgi:4-amino-4-deoxy-L-arabinose transferase-like glycosyltransferase
MLALRLVSCLAGTLIVPLVYDVTRLAFRRETLALFAAALAALHPEFTRASAEVFREVLAALLVLLAVWLFLRALRWGWKGRLGLSFAVGLVASIYAFTRPEGIFLLGCMLLMGSLLAFGVARRQRLAMCAAMVVGFALLQVPYVLWMKQETGYWMLNQWQYDRKMLQTADRWPNDVAREQMLQYYGRRDDNGS